MNSQDTELQESMIWLLFEPRSLSTACLMGAPGPGSSLQPPRHPLASDCWPRTGQLVKRSSSSSPVDTEAQGVGVELAWGPGQGKIGRGCLMEGGRQLGPSWWGLRLA